jgi:hypothetical protein
MRRRQFLRASAASTVAALSTTISGCSSLPGTGNSIQDSDGDGVIDSEDYAPNDPDVQEKSDVQNSGDGGGQNNQQTTQDSTTEQTTQQTTTQDPNLQKRKNILSTYNNAIKAQQDAMTLMNTAVKQFNNDKLQKSEQNAKSAKSKFETMESRCSNAYDLALQIENDEAQSICDRGRQYALLMASACNESVLAAQDAQKGRTDAANEHINSHQSSAQDAQQNRPRAPTVLKKVLNL